jgi:hypothetical protein
VHDTVTEPVPIAAEEAPPSRWTARPGMMVASAGLGAVMAAIVVLVWAFSSGPQSVKQQPTPDSAAAPVTAQPVAAKPSEAPKPAAGLPGGLPGLPAGLTQSGTSAAGGNPLAAFSPSPSVSSGGGGARAIALPPAPKLPPPPDLQTVLDTAAPYLLPALAPSVISGDGIASLVGNIGGWATSAGVSLFNNGTDIFTSLILAQAYAGNNGGPIQNLVRASQGISSLSKLPSLMGLPTPQQVMGLPSLTVDLPALDALSHLPAPQIGLPRLPAPPPMGMPRLPAPPKFGLPRLPPPPPIGLPRLPPPPPPALIAAFS